MKNTLRLFGLASLCGLSLSSCVVYDPVGGPVAASYPVAPGATYYAPAPAVAPVAYYDDYYYNTGFNSFGSPFFRPVGTSFTYISGGRHHDHCNTPRNYGYRYGSSGRGPSSVGMSGSAIGSRSSGSTMLRSPSPRSGSGMSGSSGTFSRPASIRSSGSSSSGTMRSMPRSSSPAPRSSAPRSSSGGSRGRSGGSSGMGAFQASR